MALKQYSNNGLLAKMTEASLIAQLVVIYLVVLMVFDSPTESQWQWGDPLLKILPQQLSLWLVPVLAFSACMFFVAKNGIDRSSLIGSIKEAALGVALVLLVSCLGRLVIGPELPDFIPPEESSKSGFILGMAAGFGEEVLFHLILMPALFFLLRGLLPYHVAVLASIAITAIAFAVLHEIGEADDVLHYGNIAARIIVPGFVMGALFFYRSPAFIISLHSAAHVMIPLLFH